MMNGTKAVLVVTSSQGRGSSMCGRGCTTHCSTLTGTVGTMNAWHADGRRMVDAIVVSFIVDSL